MNVDEYRKSLIYLKKLTKVSPKIQRSQTREIEVHLSRIIPAIEEWIKQRNFDPVQECLALLADVDKSIDFTALLGDYKFSYFIYINSAYVIQQ